MIKKTPYNTVCLVNTLFPPYAQGGTEVVVQRTIDALRHDGKRVILITTEPKNSRPGRWSCETKDDVAIYRFTPKNIYYYTDGATKPVAAKLLWHAIDMGNVADGRTIESILRKEKPDLVHGHNLKGMSYSAPNVCRRLSIPYLHSLHNYQLLHPFGTFGLSDHPPYFQPKLAALIYQYFNRRLFRHTVGVISPTSLPLAIHQKAGFFRSIPSAIFPSPVTPPLTISSPHAGGKLRFVYLGALEEIKGIRSLIQAFLHLPEEQCSLDIYGQGSLFHELQNTHRNAQHIRFLGHLDNKDLLGDYDALIYPSICYETQGLAMAEALVRSTPVIAADIGSIPETITDSVNGYLFPSGNSEALTNLLLSHIENPERLRALRNAARLSGERYHQDLYRNSLLAFYEKVRGLPKDN